MEAPGGSSRYLGGQYWRDQIRAAIGFVSLAGVALAFLERDFGFILLASAVVALPIWLVMESWLALGQQAPYEPAQRFWRDRLITAVPFLGAFAFGVFSYRRDRLDWSVLPILLPVVIGVVVRALYAWRERQTRPVGLLTASFQRISLAGACFHFASYAAALAAGIAATAYVDAWLSRMAAYVSAALLAKLAVDFVFTKPAPLNDRALSSALKRMTVVSPLWWGLPWGLLVVGHFATIESQWASIGRSIAENLSVLYHVAIATVFVFAAVTAVAFLRESRADRAWASANAEESAAMSPGDWNLLYAGVLALSLAAYAVAFVPFWRSDEDRFGVETWTCARVDDGWVLGWIAKEGIKIRVRGYVDLFNISCVPRSGGGGCDYDDEGWDEVETVVYGKDGFRTVVAFNRKSPGVKADFRHHADLYGEFGNEFLWALYNGERAEMNIKAPRGRLLYTLRMDLRGYNKALNACRAHWLKEAEGR